jgi:hypothetical protein
MNRAFRAVLHFGEKFSCVPAVNVLWIECKTRMKF